MGHLVSNSITKAFRKKSFPEELNPCYQNTFLLLEICDLTEKPKLLTWENLTAAGINSSETGTLSYMRINCVSLLDISLNNAK